MASPIPCPGRSREDSHAHADRFLARLADLQCQQVVCPRSPEIDGGDRFAGRCGRFGETEAGINHQRRSDDQQGVRVRHTFERAIDSSRGTDSPKNTTSGLRMPPHSGQSGTKSHCSRGLRCRRRHRGQRVLRSPPRTGCSSAVVAGVRRAAKCGRLTCTAPHQAVRAGRSGFGCRRRSAARRRFA